MASPVLEALADLDDPFVILGQSAHGRSTAGFADEDLFPKIPLRDGEQYRFHFDASRCIGCKCCEVACSEQNNNTPEISWRRVGEIEGGTYPDTVRLHLSMGCNHCVEPSCLTGCPTDAYTKDSATGIVLHDATQCIGCEYCIWNCSYGVPTFNEERGVVGKCDMCHGRITSGDAPACVESCPEQAIKVEIVNIKEWKREYREFANMPGLPSADDTISTTRVTLPDNIPANFEKADYHRVRPEKPHYSLVGMTVMTQLSVGAFSLVWLLAALGGIESINIAATASVAVRLISFLASPLHLGRPIYAYRAMRMWRRSWLSREIVLLTSFGVTATVYAAMLWTSATGAAMVGGLATALGIAGVFCSAYIYLVPARPAWNSLYTVAEFLLSGATLGPLFLAAAGISHQALTIVAASAAALQCTNQLLKFLWLVRSEDFELRASSRLLGSDLYKRFLARLALLVVGGIVLPLNGFAVLASLAVFAGELLGRYLFFVSVVPKNMAMPFVSSDGLFHEAA